MAKLNLSPKAKSSLLEKLSEYVQRGSESLRTITHYTSLDGFRSIIANNELWVSNVRFLNDKREMDYGLTAAAKFLEERSKSGSNANLFSQVRQSIARRGIPDAYACCFCEQSDSLGQWRGYTGGGQGVAIEFQAQNLLARCKSANATLQKVIYGVDETRKELEREIDALFAGFDQDQFEDLLGDEKPIKTERLLLSLAPRFKHKSFEDEREWRLIITNPTKKAKIEYRTKDNVIVPYIKLNMASGLPISKVRIGPGKDMKITLQSVELFLKSFERYQEVPVVESAVPFRT